MVAICQSPFGLPSALISCEDNKDKGEFRPRVRGNVMEYKWNETGQGEYEPSGWTRMRPRCCFPTERMSEIILRFIVISEA